MVKRWSEKTEPGGKLELAGSPLKRAPLTTNEEQTKIAQSEFKARVALEALKGLKPIHEIAADNEIHPVQVSQWKKEMQEHMSELFERKNARSKADDDSQKHIERLERKVGQLVVERDWLAKKSKELGIE
ncbi:MAG: transposase [Planctomycetota bacterium]